MLSSTLIRRARGPLLASASASSSAFLLTTKRGLANKVFDSAAEAIHDIKDGAWSDMEGGREGGIDGEWVGGRGGDKEK